MFGVIGPGVYDGETSGPTEQTGPTLEAMSSPAIVPLITELHRTSLFTGTFVCACVCSYTHIYLFDSFN